jgi:hypothetical protein
MQIDEPKGKCGVCLQEMAGGALVPCPKCGTAYHRECWDFNRRKCAVYGCWKSPFPKRPLGPAQRHADIFNPYVMAGMILVFVAVVVWNWVTFRSL